MAKITPKQAKIVKAKVEATLKDIPQRKWAKELYPNSSQAAAEVEVSKNLNKPNVKEALQQELAKQGITIEAVVKPIADGLKAEKVSIVGNGDQAMAEITPDHNIRIKSSQIAGKWLGLDQQNDSTNSTFIQINNTLKSKYDD